MTNSFTIERWFLFGIVSFIFFLIIGATFGSLGVALPSMLLELGWSWPQAGTGFTILALLTGITALIPAWMLRRFGIKSTYGTGGLVMTCGFVLLATCHSITQFYLATALLGYGFSHCATVPAVHMLNNWMPDKRSLAIGWYMTIGGLGGVAGPLLVTSVESATGSWRMYWWLVAASMFLITLVAVIFVKAEPDRKLKDEEVADPLFEKQSERVYKTATDWNYRDVVLCPQYYVIVAAMSMTLFCTVTMSAWAVVHMGTFGVSTAIAATAMSSQALLNAASRAFGGILATRIDPKWLLVSALLAEVIGMMGLSIADNPVMIALFVFGEGYGFGMCLFATTILLFNYFGPKQNPEILGTLNLITTVAMVGPVLAGYIGYTYGGFGIVFQGYAFFLLLIAVAVAMMRPPTAKQVDIVATNTTK
ncbi:MAG: OFA family oxalate/formate antiporter-like MFS transporter [Gammaproteobacteria bacterium]|jgi:OFA family oxalate/formate antiporter-like MFS transporter